MGSNDSKILGKIMSSNIRKNNIIKVVAPKDNFSAKQIGSQDFNLDVTSDKVGH